MPNNFNLLVTRPFLLCAKLVKQNVHEIDPGKCQFQLMFEQ